MQQEMKGQVILSVGAVGKLKNSRRLVGGVGGKEQKDAERGK